MVEYETSQQLRDMGSMEPDTGVLDMRADMSSMMPDLSADMPFMVDPDAECSINGGESISVEFKNATGQTIDLYWITPDCVPVKYTTLADGEGYSQQTFVGHVWVFAPQFTPAINLPSRRVVLLDASMTEIELMEAP